LKEISDFIEIILIIIILKFFTQDIQEKIYNTLTPLKKMLIKKKRGQANIFIILGILVVAGIGILILIMLQGKPIIEINKPEENPKYFLEECIEPELRKNLNIISHQGGYIENSFSKKFKFKGEEYWNISYLCYNRKNYLSCINQEPLLIQHLEKEISNSIKIKVEDCYNKYEETLIEKGYDAELSQYSGFELELKKGRIFLDINGELKLSRGEEVSTQENLKIIYRSDLYQLAVLAQEIVSQEAQYCNFDSLGYSMLHSDIDINKTLINGEVIYTLQEVHSKDKFRFAIRTCFSPDISSVIPKNSEIDLFDKKHKLQDCIDTGGEPVSEGKENGGEIFCVFDRTICPAGWSQYKEWSQTVSRSCQDNCYFNNDPTFEQRCETGQHSLSNKPIETCTYKQGEKIDSITAGGYCDNYYTETCYAKVKRIGCY